MLFVSADLKPVDSLANPVTWQLPLLAPGDSAMVTVRVRVPGRVGPTRNTATVTGTFHDKVPANNRAVFTTEITPARSEEHTSELQSLMRISYAVFCLKKKNIHTEATKKKSITTLTTTHKQPS